MLTRKQYELLVFIDQRLKEAGVSPSFDEMKDALGLRSKSGIHRLITGLEERGFIRRLPHRARALEVLRLPENMAGIPVETKEKASPGGFSPNVIQGDFKLSGAPAAAESEAVQLPLWGRIAAGTPIEALRDHSNSVSIPASMLGKGEHYALDVEGDSMVDAGILDGDTESQVPGSHIPGSVMSLGLTGETELLIPLDVADQEQLLSYQLIKEFLRQGLTEPAQDLLQEIDVETLRQWGAAEELIQLKQQRRSSIH